MKRIVLFALFVLSLQPVKAQNSSMQNGVEDIKKLGKEAIIKLAIGYLHAEHNNLQVDSADFDISVWSNNQQVIVKFERKVKYTPLRFKGSEPPFYTSSISFDLTVDIISTTKCRLDTWFAKDFYVPTNEDLENIGFVDKHFGLHQEWFETEVSEDETHFSVVVSNEVSFGHYFIDKDTGKQTIPPIQGSYEPNPFPELDQEEDPMRMIKMN